jgi:hypothetical protein
MSRKVIVKFRDFATRKGWLLSHNYRNIRIYKYNPWIGAELSENELRELTRHIDVEVFEDVKMEPEKDYF